MKELNTHKVGVVFGLIAGGCHLAWSLLVAFGFAQILMDWIYGLHFLNNPFSVMDFNVGTATTLVAVTFIVGYVMGWVFAWVWNKMHR